MNIGIKKKKIRPVIHLVVRELRPAKVKKPVPAKEINDLFWFRDESYYTSFIYSGELIPATKDILREKGFKLSVSENGLYFTVSF